MTNFKIDFERPWFLLLLIPALILTMIPYFRLAKKYRRTRNRVVSIVLHLMIMVLSISVLAGITFSYDIPNTENEVILLIDTSFSGTDSEEEKNQFIEEVVNSNDGSFKLGIVTFGYNQIYAAELTQNTQDVFSQYMASERPDHTATDFASALTFASEKFNSPQTARIVVISDGIQTDGNTAAMIKQLAATGIKVDTVCFPNGEVGNEVLLLNVQMPEQNIRVGEEFELSLNLKSSYKGNSLLKVYDNDTELISIPVELAEGEQAIPVKMEFALPGMHDLSFVLEAEGDTLQQNNLYNTHVYLDVFDRVLIIESIAGQSDSVKNLLTEGDLMKVTVVDVSDEENMPNTLNELRAFDEVMLYNISNSDMPEGFDKLLYQYVYEVGGGLFTVCGNKPDTNPNDEYWDANAFTREDMYGTLYQDMLPVEVINYTPPVAVAIIIDRSRSMWYENEVPTYEDSKFYAAKQGAIACLDALTERDYVTVLSLSDREAEELELTPRTQRAKILSAIDEIEIGGTTIYEGALSRARGTLMAQTDVERRHIILVTDGEPEDMDPELYLEQVRLNKEMGITMSIVGVQCTPAASQCMLELVTEAGGTSKNYHDVVNVRDVPEIMREDLMVPEIKDVNYETFTPTIVSPSSPVMNNITQDNMFSLDGFYGTKAKEGADVILSSKYVPIYAQWRYGKGMVGSFMCDLNGVWSAELLSCTEGSTLIKNIVAALFPAENIRVNDIELEIKEGNYNTQLSIFTSLTETQSLRVTVTSPDPNDPMNFIEKVYTPGTNGTYSRLNFDVTSAGLHKILVQKLDENGQVIPDTDAVIYRSFSYSAEYDPFHEAKEGEDYLANLAKDGKGEVIANYDPWGVFENVVKFLRIVIDPRIVFIILALVFFLLDIAVRKFKFKWPHELYHDYKLKKQLNQK